MTDPTADALVAAVTAEAASRGITNLPVEQAYAIVRGALAFIAGKFDEAAKAHAAAAGDAARDGVTTEDAAEMAQRERK